MPSRTTALENRVFSTPALRGKEIVWRRESTTSWAYSMELNSLNTGLKIFMSRAVTGDEGEDLEDYVPVVARCHA